MSLLHVISSWYFPFRVSPFSLFHPTKVCVFVQLKLRGGSCCCCVYRYMEQITQHSDNLKTQFFQRLFQIWCLQFLLIYHFPKFKVIGCAHLSLYVCSYLELHSGYQKFKHKLFIVLGFVLKFAVWIFFLHICKEGNVPYQYHSSK